MALLISFHFVLLFCSISVLGAINPTPSGCTQGPCDTQVTTLFTIAQAFRFSIPTDTWEGNDSCRDWTFIICTDGQITTINFGRQHLGGIISPAFANLTSLENLYLNDNNLTGEIPWSLTSLPLLQNLDISNNDLSGVVPNFAVSVELNTKGNPLLAPGGRTGESDSNGNPSANRSSVSGMIVGMVFAAIISAVMLFALFKFYVNRRHSQSSGEAIDLHVFEGGNDSISIELLRQVTDNFSQDNILGRGGFGVVYKGELHDGTKIAVKRMESGAMGSKGMNEFKAEINVLTKVRHRHLVALLGHCINGNERMLVFEYMPQGTLTQHLFHWQENGCAPLTWMQRITIALDVARGVEYLHNLAQQSFIHRDLKPSNILLGDDMRAKVADFGLVRKVPDGRSSVETRMAGTFGYLPPEYGATGRVTTKVDVYAFGVVLMEILTGRRALDNTLPEEQLHLVSWFHQINKENIPTAIDQTLNPDEETMESIYKVAELAGHCTAREPHQRPDMRHIVNSLGPLVEQWNPVNQQDEEMYGIDPHMSLSQALQRWQAGEGTSTMTMSNEISPSQS